jgi:hypothetical protein
MVQMFAIFCLLAMIVITALIPTMAVACGIQKIRPCFMLKNKGFDYEKYLYRCGPPGGDPRRRDGWKQGI